ncbi:GMC oxidoreductase-like protein [Rhexocercosporidium sp. MPI-PUGE-AT-0058]|nr:GMC oxidoreductase-like protein [Rhexocercosporidium sp. MPI-PUGE-AT-0058]
MARTWYRNSIFVAALALFSSATASVTATNKNNDNTYDYIVVGSGPGGGTLAANLAKAGQSVLLIEAGDDQGKNPHEEVAGLFFLSNNDPVMRWDFFVKYHSNETINDEFDRLTWRTKEGLFYVGLDPPAGSTKLGVYYPRAGTLGGCSTHNAMVAALPSNSDWQNVVDLTGDKSWTADNMRKYFVKLENDHIVPKGTVGHGFSGFLDLSTSTDLANNPHATEVLQTTAELFGQDSTDIVKLLMNDTDLNNNAPNRDQQVGLFGLPRHSDVRGRRVSARNAVVNVWNATNPNGSKKYPLTVSLRSFATKILFDQSGYTPRATGIEYVVGESFYSADPRHKASTAGTTKQAFARKEVIISGGAFNSPQLLMLSGIGPKADLQKLHIKSIVDLPGVGSNLQDNTEYGVSAQSLTSNFTTLNQPACTFGAPNDPCLALWQDGKGPYATLGSAALMVKTSAAAFNERDMFMFPAYPGAFRGYWPSETVNTVPSDPASSFDFSMVKIHAQSRLGTVKLTSNDPRDVPSINFRFFEGKGADADLQAFAEGIDFGRKVFDTLTEKGSQLAPFEEILPCNGPRNCNVKEIVRAQAWSHHATSTCAIGSNGDSMAVLDSSFRVRGTKGLRVVDASAFPRTPGGFPVIPTFMLGMKATDVILKDANSW